nr:SpoIIE family protein phosphatase [Herpetosiphonaceae bacterium]
VPLQPGDSIVLMSDGVVEARNEHGVMFGFEQIESLFTNHAIHSSLDVSLDHTLAQVAAFIGAGEQHDDVTLVLLHFNGAEQQ